MFYKDTFPEDDPQDRVETHRRSSVLTVKKLCFIIAILEF